ncbi:MAG: hypothetical protein LBF74_04795 [Treponema sp.]|jgi:hypothetical protein|nr:hypothetical protein [Treponema sp.]
MAEKKAIYAPGELSKVRERLGSLDSEEAKRMSQILGGEVGIERGDDPVKARLAATRGVIGGGKGGKRPGGGISGGQTSAPHRRVDHAPNREAGGPADIPVLPVKLKYTERVKMDKFMGRTRFEIKTLLQVLLSIFSIRPSRDLVSARFITVRLSDYCRYIESLVTATRTLCPRNNIRRDEQLKKASGFAFKIIDTIRDWNIGTINADLSRARLHPKKNTIPEMAELLKLIYKPILILDEVDFDTGIRAAYKLVYKIIFLENPGVDIAGQQEMIKTALTSLNYIRKEIRYLLYPMLMKLLSDRWLPYGEFFDSRRKHLMAFLGLTEQEVLRPPPANVPRSGEPEKDQTGTAGKEEDGPEENNDAAASEEDAGKTVTEKAVQENERKALERGLKTLETLFPRSGWSKIDSGDDLYPYFANVFKFPKEYALISPSDGLQHIVVLLRILQELFYGLRMVDFGVIPGSGGPDELGKNLGSIINDWYFFTTTLEKEYLPRLSEYCRILESSSESRTSSYSRRLLSELCWIKRCFFLPYYKFMSPFPCQIQKKDVKPLSSGIRLLRRHLTTAAGCIEKSIKAGGAAGNVRCEGINNPWDPYNFQVSNPVSVRLDAILNPKQRNNASLIFFTLAAAIVLDFLVNNEASWAYQTNVGRDILFRSVNGEGVEPLWDTAKTINTDALLKGMQNRTKAKGGES